MVLAQDVLSVTRFKRDIVGNITNMSGGGKLNTIIHKVQFITSILACCHLLTMQAGVQAG